MTETPYLTENEIKVLLTVGRNNQPLLEQDEDLLNQRQLAEESEINKKAFQRAKPKLKEHSLIDTEKGGNGGMVKLTLTDKGVEAYEHYEALADLFFEGEDTDE